MPQEWMVPMILTGLALMLLAIWVPVWRENRKQKK